MRAGRHLHRRRSAPRAGGGLDGGVPAVTDQSRSGNAPLHFRSSGFAPERRGYLRSIWSAVAPQFRNSGDGEPRGPARARPIPLGTQRTAQTTPLWAGRTTPSSRLVRRGRRHRWRSARTDRARGWSADPSRICPTLAEAIVCRLCYNRRTRECICAGRKPALRLGRAKRNHHVRQDQGCAQRR